MVNKIDPIKIKSEFHTPESQNINTLRKLTPVAVEEGKITEDDKFLIDCFIAEKSSENAISTKRKIKIIRSLILWRKYMGEYRTCTYPEVSLAIDGLKAAKTDKGTPYKQNSLRDHMGFLKRFLLWMIEEEYNTNLSERKVLRLKVPPKDKMTIKVGDILSHREVMKMIKVCKNSRDRAIISMMYEGAFRGGEIGTMVWGDVMFRDTGLVVNTDFKTKKPRRVLLANSTGYLAAWKDDYPYEITPEMPIFLTFANNNPKDGAGGRDPNRPVYRGISYPGLRLQLKKIAKRAGIERNFKPHIFRHSRITHLLQAGFHETYIKKMCWGTVTTDQLQTYAHLDDTYMDEMFYKYEGIEMPQKAETERCEAVQCPRCSAVNSCNTRYCRRCGFALDDSTALAHKEIVEFIEGKISEMANENPEELANIIQQFASAK